MKMEISIVDTELFEDTINMFHELYVDPNISQEIKDKIVFKLKSTWNHKLDVMSLLKYGYNSK